MNYSDYQERIKDFAVYPRIGNNLSYAVLGLINEFGEFIEKLSEILGVYPSNFHLDLLEGEAGDSCWYLGTCYNEIGENWSKILEDNSELYENTYIDVKHSAKSDTMFAIGISFLALARLAGFAKKAERDNGGNLLDNHRKEFTKILFIVQATLSCILEEYGISLQDVMKGNLSKLQSRKERNVLHGDGDNR